MLIDAFQLESSHVIIARHATCELLSDSQIRHPIETFFSKKH